MSLPQGALPRSALLLPPPPPLGCCTKCGFSREPACFLESYGQVVSTGPLRYVDAAVRSLLPAGSCRWIEVGRRKAQSLVGDLLAL